MRHAFTLIELIIAMAIGLVVVFGMFAAVRTTSQTLAAAKRLAVENSLLATGYLELERQVDWWEAWDDPAATAAPGAVSPRPLRRMAKGVIDGAQPELTPPSLPAQNWGAPTEGLPFTPLAWVIPTMATAPGTESSRGWEPDFAWPASDPRTWARGLVYEAGGSRGYQGRYQAFSCASPTAGPASLTAGQTANYGAVTPPRHWHDTTMLSLLNAMGFYAFFDYLPAGTLYMARSGGGGGSAGAQADTSSAGGIARLLAADNGQRDRLWNGDGGQAYCRDRWRVSMGSGFAIDAVVQLDTLTAVSSARAPFLLPGQVVDADLYPYNTLWRDARRWHAIGLYSEGGQAADDSWTAGNKADASKSVAEFTVKSSWNLPIADAAPADWPLASVTMQRYLKTSRFIDQGRIMLRNQASGEAMGIATSLFGTTLRGARMQRRLPTGTELAADAATGWVAWDNTAAFVTARATATIGSAALHLDDRP